MYANTYSISGARKNWKRNIHDVIFVGKIFTWIYDVMKKLSTVYLNILFSDKLKKVRLLAFLNIHVAAVMGRKINLFSI